MAGAMMQAERGDRSGERRVGPFPNMEERQHRAQIMSQTSLLLVHGALAGCKNHINFIVFQQFLPGNEVLSSCFSTQSFIWTKNRGGKIFVQYPFKEEGC